MANNINIIAEGLAGDNEGRVLGYNDTDFGYKAPIVGTLERDSVASYIDKNGVLKFAPKNQLRVDYTNGVAEMLLEPSSTNLITYSEDFTGWTSVSGASTTELQINFSSSSTSRAYESLGRTINSGQVIYIRVKFSSQDVGKNIRFGIFKGGSWNYTNNIEISDDGFAEYTEVLDSDMTILGIVRDTQSQTNQVSIEKGRHCVQIEELSHPTSYIPTNGSIATRQADSLTDFGFEQVIDSQSGILFFEGSLLSNTSTSTQMSLSDGSTNNRAFVNFGSGTSSLFAGFQQAGATQYNYTLNINDKTTNFKIALRYASSNFSFWFNGIQVDSQLSGATPSDNRLNNLSMNAPNTAPFYGRVRQLKHPPFNTDISSL